MEQRAGRREWIALVTLALPCLLYSMDLTVLNLAVPRGSRPRCRRAGAINAVAIRSLFTDGEMTTPLPNL
jgi:hypothetical protein